MAILIVGCTGSPGVTPAGGGAGASSGPASTNTAAPGDSVAPSDTPAASSAGALPADCADGFTAYLTAIEPIVSSFDPSTAKLGDVETVDSAVQEKSMELLIANDSTAPYSCPDVGLEWSYFDASTPWDAVLATAADAAPGTVAYLTTQRDMANLDVAKVADYGVSGCDEAVAKIKADVAAQTVDGARDMALADGLALLGLYKAYLRDVQTEACPRDALGNDEFDFFLGVG